MGDLLKTLTTDDIDNHVLEVVHVTIGNPVFCLTLNLTGAHFRGELQHVSHVGGQKTKCRPISTKEIGGVRLQE